jgi:hypothetical protein
MISEPKIHRLIVRRTFSIGGTLLKKGETFEGTIVGAKVCDGVEVAGLQVGDTEPQGIPYEMFAFADANAD